MKQITAWSSNLSERVLIYNIEDEKLTSESAAEAERYVRQCQERGGLSHLGRVSDFKVE